MLYFVATPIGNLGDISYRGIETLKSVDLIGCEDTRHSIHLLEYYDIKKPLFSYHKFNEKEVSEKIIQQLQEGKSIAIISDAGTPAISDPGNVLTKILMEKGIEYTVIPGASACISALVLSGLDTSRFTFIGFLPEKKGDRDKLIKEYKNVSSTLIFHSAPQDVNKDIKDLYNILGDRKCSVVKEITKIHETVYHINLKDGEIDNPKGEFVLVVEGNLGEEEKGFFLTEKEHIDLYISRGMSKKEAIKKVAEERGVSKNSLYKYTINDESIEDEQ